MPRDVALTQFPVRVSATGSQDLRLATDVLAFDELDLELRVVELSGGGSPSITVSVETGMQRESSLGWITVATFSSVSAVPASEKLNITGLLRYVRWKVSLLGSLPFATFELRGVGRSWSESAVQPPVGDEDEALMVAEPIRSRVLSALTARDERARPQRPPR